MFCLNKQQCKCYVPCIQCLLIVKGGFRGGGVGTRKPRPLLFSLKFCIIFIEFSVYIAGKCLGHPFLNFLDSPLLLYAITCKGKSTRPLNNQFCLLCHLRKTKQIQQLRWKLVKATSRNLSHLLPATQAQGTSAIGWNGNFLSKFGERGDDQLSKLEHFMINKRRQ